MHTEFSIAKGRHGIWAILLGLICGFSAARAQTPSKPDLTDTSLEELMNIEVTTVSRKEERLFQTATAITVITQEDIRRSGMTSLPELLRLVPGMNVVRLNTGTWAVNARGFNERFANKMLVLVDGRQVYTQLFSGVFWDAQEMMLENIERIEIIRGPGGALWGTNAVNGVINIVTKHAKEMQGGLVSVSAGNEDRAINNVRLGGKLGERGFYMAYARQFNRAITTPGESLQSLFPAIRPESRWKDDWNNVRGGGRVDWKKSERDSLTGQGEYYRQGVNQLIPGATAFIPPIEPALLPGRYIGGYGQGRWNRILSDQSDFMLQVSYEQTHRDDPLLDETRNTFQFDAQYRRSIGSRHDLVAGVGYRITADRTKTEEDPEHEEGHFVELEPQGRSLAFYSFFAQDEITLAKNRLKLTLGAKFEHNEYTHLETQPSARLLWTPNENNSVWASVSRAVRTPSRIYREGRVNAGGFPGPGGAWIVARLLGDDDFQSEDLLAYQAGYRIQPTRNISLDVASYYNVYTNLLTTESGRPYPGVYQGRPYLVLPLTYENQLSARTFGGEFSANWNIANRWRLSGSYSLFKARFRVNEASGDQDDDRAENNSPDHQAMVRSVLNLPRNFEFDTTMLFVGRLQGQHVPGYSRLDLRLGWRLKERLEFSVGGQNLLDRRHFEFGLFSQGLVPAEIRRSFYGRVTWRF